MSWWSGRHRPVPPAPGRIRPDRRDTENADRKKKRCTGPIRQAGRRIPHPQDAPRVTIIFNLVPHWATWDHFNELDKKGLAMYTAR